MSGVALSFHSLHPDVDLGQRFAAVAAAGFDELTLSSRRLSAWTESGHDLGELADLIEACGVRVSALEVLIPLLAEPDPQEAALFAQARALGVNRVQVIGPFEGAARQAAPRFAGLCDRAAGDGLAVVLEFLPWTNVPDAATAREIVEQAGRDNGGICLDVWHLYRSGADPGGLAQIWPFVTTVQLNDGPVAAEGDDLERECRTRRLIPGDGDFDLVALLKAVKSHRPQAYLEIEIPSDQLRALPSAVAAARIAEGTNRTLAAAGWDPSDC
jgi:sugar phosphate isomerase/epimerase